MVKNGIYFIIGLAIGAILIFSILSTKSDNWKPVMEATSFAYFDTILYELDTSISEAIQKVAPKTSPVLDPLNRAHQAAYKLQLYYYPLTVIRQDLFDADRFYYLGQLDQSRKMLQHARTLALSVASERHLEVKAAMHELIALIDTLLVDIDESSPEIASLFQQAGHRANLLLLRGELVLSGSLLDDRTK